jgi:hypothetical protein
MVNEYGSHFNNYLLILVYALMSSCSLSQGHKGVSSSIEESKRREVFECEYYPKNNPYQISDSISLDISNVWLERQWGYGSNSETIPIEGYQLVIHTTPQSKKNYFDTWVIGVDGKRYFRPCGKTCLMTDFDSIPSKIESWYVQSGHSLDTASRKILIGEFTLIRKD